MPSKSEKEKRDAFQKRLSDLISAAGSIEAFCEKVSLPYYQVNQYLGGKTNSEPSRVILEAIIEACQVDANWLISGNGGLTGLSNEALQTHIHAVDQFYDEYSQEVSPELRRSRLRALFTQCKTLLDATANTGEVPLAGDISAKDK